MADKWIDAKKEQPPEFISVLGFFESFVPFPTVRECFRVPNGYDIPALSEIVPFDALTRWMKMPEPPIKINYVEDKAQ